MADILLKSKNWWVSKKTFKAQVVKVNHDLFEAKDVKRIDQYVLDLQRNPYSLGKIKTVEQLLVVLGRWVEILSQQQKQWYSPKDKWRYFQQRKLFYQFWENNYQLLQKHFGLYGLESFVSTEFGFLEKRIQKKAYQDRISGFMDQSVTTIGRFFQSEECLFEFLIYCPQARLRISAPTLRELAFLNVKVAQTIAFSPRLLSHVGKNYIRELYERSPNKLRILLKDLQPAAIIYFLKENRDWITGEHLCEILPSLKHKLSKDQLKKLYGFKDSKNRCYRDKIRQYFIACIKNENLNLPPNNLMQVLRIPTLFGWTDVVAWRNLPVEYLIHWLEKADFNQEVCEFLSFEPQFHEKMARYLERFWKEKQNNFNKFTQIAAATLKNYAINPGYEGYLQPNMNPDALEVEFENQFGKVVPQYLLKSFYLYHAIAKSKKIYQSHQSAQKVFLKKFIEDKMKSSGCSVDDAAIYLVIIKNENYWRDVGSLFQPRKLSSLHPFFSARILQTKNKISFEEAVLQLLSSCNNMQKFMKLSLHISRCYPVDSFILSSVKEMLLRRFYPSGAQFYNEFLTTFPQNEWRQSVALAYKKLIDPVDKRKALEQSLNNKLRNNSVFRMMIASPLGSLDPLKIIYAMAGIDAQFGLPENYLHIAKHFAKYCGFLDFSSWEDVGFVDFQKRYQNLKELWSEILEHPNPNRPVINNVAPNFFKYLEELGQFMSWMAAQNFTVTEIKRIKDAASNNPEVIAQKFKEGCDSKMQFEKWLLENRRPEFKRMTKIPTMKSVAAMKSIAVLLPKPLAAVEEKASSIHDLSPGTF